jgi:DNA invertase Pin-like site-specific DNA recombinase
MLIGYARVSTFEQNLNLQKDALKAVGCEKIFEDHISGAASSRPGMNKAIEFLRKGDTLVVWRLDRLGRSLKHLIEVVSLLEERHIGFKSLQEAIDTTSSGGKLIFHIFGALAEFERNLIRERTIAGLSAARARGRKGGRPKALDSQKREIAVILYHQKEKTVKEICSIMGISKPTLYRYIRSEQASQSDSSSKVT